MMKSKKALVLGGDGYIGWPLALRLSKAGYDVTICDNFNKRKWELEIGIRPLLHIPILQDRVKVWEKIAGSSIKVVVGDLTNQRFVYDLFQYKPDVVIHGADQPSAPFSMKGINTASVTQTNNTVAGMNVLFAIKRSCPGTLYVRLGASSLAVADKDRSKDLFTSDSFYELSRLHDYNNTLFCCKNWGLTAAMINTGVVYGMNTEETQLHDKLKTSFNYDRVFGTLINRFCVECVLGMPLTIYGDGQHRCGFTSLQRAINNIVPAVENREDFKSGELNIINSFESVISVNKAAENVRQCAGQLGFETSISFIENPRREFVTARDRVFDKFSQNSDPSLDTEVLLELIKKIVENKNGILADSILPVIKWLM